FGEAAYAPKANEWKQGTETAAAPTDGTHTDEDNKMMTPLAQAEWLKRLAMHEKDKNTAMPNLLNEDIETLFYGTETVSTTNKARLPQSGMGAGISRYVVQGLVNNHDAALADLQKMMNDLGGENWRVFQKLGSGYSTKRSREEILVLSNVCLPKLD